MTGESVISKESTEPLPYKYSSSAQIHATAEDVFSFLDDPRHLSSHMEKSSLMMAGSSMRIELDSKEGKAIGAEIILRGAIMGIPLFIREVVSDRQPPIRKLWETVGTQKMIILDQYRMGFEISPRGRDSFITVSIEFALPNSLGRKILGLLLGKVYARWCTQNMANCAAHHFSRKHGL